MDLVDRYLNGVKDLPPAPTVAIQLLDVFNDPDRDIDRIVKLISHDASLTAETLQRCNHGCFQGAEPAQDMFDAVSRLGLYEIYSIVLSLTASRTMNKVRAKYGPDAHRLWQHTVVTAVISSALAKRVQVVEATAFTAGLLHDIGKLILVSMEGVVYAEMVRTAGFFGPKLAAAERASLGFTHASLGGRLLQRWGMPDGLRLAVELHDQSPANAPSHMRLVAVVNFANSLAHQIVDNSPDTPTAAAASLEAMELVGLAADDIPELVQQINFELKRVQRLLHANI